MAIFHARIRLEGLVASYDGDQLLTAASDTYMEPGSPDAIERAQAKVEGRLVHIFHSHRQLVESQQLRNPAAHDTGSQQPNALYFLSFTFRLFHPRVLFEVLIQVVD